MDFNTQIGKMAHCPVDVCNIPSKAVELGND